MYAGGKGPDETRQRIPRERWGELAESIGAYLLYARQHYGWEPALLSFNEPDEGVKVEYSPQELRDLIKLVGAHLEKVGLRTKFAVPETALRRGYEFVQPILDDPQARRYVGEHCRFTHGRCRRRSTAPGPIWLDGPACRCT